MRIALVGNPNTGKSSLFNTLTGLNQKVGNYPGVTVDKKVGFFSLPNGEKVELIDLPGTYSLHPSSKDEEVVTEALCSPKYVAFPDAILVVADATNLKRNLLLVTQVLDLQMPVILALNMSDVAEKQGIKIDAAGLQNELGIPVHTISARKNIGVAALKSSMENGFKIAPKTTFKIPAENEGFVKQAKQFYSTKTDYAAWLLGHANMPMHNKEYRHAEAANLTQKHNLNSQRCKVNETVNRYSKIGNWIKKYTTKTATGNPGFTGKLDAILTHKIGGFVIFAVILLVIFQAIFSWSEWPMELIENFFGTLANSVGRILPSGAVSDLLTQGVIPGIAGVLVFIPQIALLFAFIAILEETGYMSRVVFIMDKLMRRFGLNGKSVVPLLSGLACAIPAVMATRGISNFKERLITILVTPFMTCSARLPVYTVLIALVIPSKKLLGIFNFQGVVLFALYVFGFVMAILSAIVFNKILKTNKKSFLVMEMPPYKWPVWRNMGLTILEKIKSFVFSAGKIIVAISIVLWILATYSPGNTRELAIQRVEQQAKANNWDAETKELHFTSARLESSYIGIFGKAIEPAIKPLGYDWKIGIALISSFAAREVFVGTMATIYSVGQEEAEIGVKQQMANDVDLETGNPRYTLAVAVSLLIFYALAMQCMSTLAVVYRETKGWKWPIIQFVFMTGLAYILSFIAYQILK